MIKNYFNTAWRSLWRNKITSIVNIAGLAIGISAALVIYLIVDFQFSFDHFEDNEKSIFRVITRQMSLGTTFYTTGVPSPLADAVQKEISGLDLVTPFYIYNGNAKVSIPLTNKTSVLKFENQDNIIFADANYFKLVSYKWLIGSEITALQKPNGVVLTESQAKLYFPGISLYSLMGRQVVYDDTVKTVVTGIVKPPDEHSDFIFHDFISSSTIRSNGLRKIYGLNEWGSLSSNSQLYLKLRSGSKSSSIETMLSHLSSKFIKQDKNYKNTWELQPLSELHFNSNYTKRVSDKPTLYGLVAIACFLLTLGCINFINLTTAQASKRSKEVGIRKTMGSSKKQIAQQYLSETFFLSLLATLVSLLLTPFLIKIFSSFIPREISFNVFQHPQILIFLLLLIIVVSIISGFYPAYILAGFSPVRALKNLGQSNTGISRGAWIRRSLTVSQFLIAQFFIISTLIVVKQVQYSLNKNLGFKKEGIITFDLPFLEKNNHGIVLRDHISTLPGVLVVSLGSNPPAGSGYSIIDSKYKKGVHDIHTNVHITFGDTKYLELYHIPLIAGRNIKRSDTIREVIINETYALMLGFKNAADAINKKLLLDNAIKPIVGVLADYHDQSMQSPISPLLFSSADNNCNRLNVALKPQVETNDWGKSIDKIKLEFAKVYPDHDFDFHFLDAEIARLYENDQNISILLKWSTGITIFISCLGLLGLVIFTTNIRTKEIGIRKVLGASVSQVLTLLTKDFLGLVLIGFVMAVPLAWWATDKWLQQFAFKTNIGPWIFILSGISMMLIALLTLSFQVIKVSFANPVDSLKN